MTIISKNLENKILLFFGVFFFFAGSPKKYQSENNFEGQELYNG